MPVMYVGILLASELISCCILCRKVFTTVTRRYNIGKTSLQFDISPVASCPTVLNWRNYFIISLSANNLNSFSYKINEFKIFSVTFF